MKSPELGPTGSSEVPGPSARRVVGCPRRPKPGPVVVITGAIGLGRLVTEPNMGRPGIRPVSGSRWATGPEPFPGSR